MNSFNLLRNNLLGMVTKFYTLQHILLYYHYWEGRLDYPFLPRDVDSKEVLKRVKIYLPDVKDASFDVVTDCRTTAG